METLQRKNEGWQSQKIESLIGEQILINPNSLLNKKRLYATQKWINDSKLIGAIKGLPDSDELPVSVLIADERQDNKVVRTLTVTEGHHRMGIATLGGNDILAQVQGVYEDSKKRYGFNVIVKEIWRRISQS
jgi:hypothetical protein